MIFRFIILSDEVDDFRRDVLIDSDASFYDLHHAILDAAGYQKDQMSSFFICDEDWTKETEITLVEMDTSSEEDSYVMDSTRLSDLLEDEKQKLIYMFEYLTERSFFMELREIIPGKSLEKPECIKSVGVAPPQLTEFDEITNINPAASLNPDDDDFLFDQDINLDEYDEEDFGDLSDDTNLF
ncbi:plasmid pRiA4b ORF-3 family protein [Bacteroidales bacterium OttesenSCG-928-A17]|nr:plasmid pRiA4b ORF-3 family protein [Bacteroidales bacterium OttesenSCG-928-A17]